jgi:hypothetical protein
MFTAAGGGVDGALGGGDPPLHAAVDIAGSRHASATIGA